jgi:hypothetical protein
VSRHCLTHWQALWPTRPFSTLPARNMHVAPSSSGLVKNPCRAPVACVLLNLRKRVVKYQALTNFSFQNLILDRCRLTRKFPLCSRRNAASAVKQRRRNHPGDFPFSVVATLDANYTAKLKLHDFIFFAARDEQGDEFAEKRQVADDHHVAAGLFGKCCNFAGVV